MITWRLQLLDIELKQNTPDVLRLPRVDIATQHVFPGSGPVIPWLKDHVIKEYLSSDVSLSEIFSAIHWDTRNVITGLNRKLDNILKHTSFYNLWHLASIKIKFKVPWTELLFWCVWRCITVNMTLKSFSLITSTSIIARLTLREHMTGLTKPSNGIRCILHKLILHLEQRNSCCANKK